MQPSCATRGNARQRHFPGPANICIRIRLWRSPKNPQRATDPDCRPSGSSAPHHRAPPAYGPPQTDSCNTPGLPGYIRAHRLLEVHACLPPAGRNAQSVRAPLQRSLPGPVTERENNTNPRARQVHHRVSRQGQGRGTTTTTFNPAADATPAAPPPPIALTTRSGRHVLFPARFNS
jgi:hypothetical protein